jgi:serine/threonine-protein kinase HipA
MRSLEVYCHGIPAGVLEERPGEGFVFTYYKKYLDDFSLPSISLTLPKRPEAYSSKTLFPFFVNMLSEGHNRTVQARSLHVAQDDDFGILAATAGVDTPGAITVKPLVYA